MDAFVRTFVLSGEAGESESAGLRLQRELAAVRTLVDHTRLSVFGVEVAPLSASIECLVRAGVSQVAVLAASAISVSSASWLSSHQAPRPLLVFAGRARHLALVTGHPPVFSLTDATPRQLAGSLALLRVDARRVVTRRRALLFARHARRASLCVLWLPPYTHQSRVPWYQSIRALYYRVHHTRTIKAASPGINPYAHYRVHWCLPYMNHCVHWFSHTPLEPCPSVWGELLCMHRRPLLSGNAARSPPQCFPRPKPSLLPCTHLLT